MMRRPIVFRAWNKRVKQMKQVERIFFNEDTVEVYLGFTDSDKATWFLEHCDLMQFTGVFDNAKEEKPIFELDLITAEVVFERQIKGALTVTESEVYFKKGSFFVMSDQQIPVLLSDIYDIKITGNFYQKPERT